jgi:cobyrinic acid a,c-diamide synthase
MTQGIIISAPSSASGKTTITLGLLRALKRSGVNVQSAKSGPDYIDPRFHAAASGAECVNLDAWAMCDDRIRALATASVPLIIEGAMGLFDGAPPHGKGATADLATILNLPVVLVLDVASQAQSVAAVALGFANLRRDVKIAGLILNKVGSPRHEAMLRGALDAIGIPVLGAVYRQANLETPSRHLGLVQAQERDDLDAFLESAAYIVEQSVDIERLMSLASVANTQTTQHPRLPPPAQSIAIARDRAFAFAYPHLLADWRAQGAEISFFSPLNDEAPAKADMVFLPGGYPELHAGVLAAASNFKSALSDAPCVYGECGGYMTMGEGLIDADGHRHEMLGLLNLETSFAKRKLHLGYRRLKPNALWTGTLSGHEFHYASTLKAIGEPLFFAKDAAGDDLPSLGLINGCHAGSFAHIIDRHDP